jgi:hypothetical protein
MVANKKLPSQPLQGFRAFHDKNIKLIMEKKKNTNLVTAFV